MSYDAPSDPYIDQRTGTLKNLQNINTPKALDDFETELTTVIIATIQLPSSYTRKDFTKRLFLEVHKEIFSDIYAWAGEVRTIDIIKGNSYFSHAGFIEKNLDDLFGQLISDVQLDSHNSSIFTKAITHYYSELNAIHPFREGNGRTIRTFLRLLAINRGWDIDWSKLSRKDNTAMMIAAFSDNESGLYTVLSPIIAPYNKG